MSTVTVLVPWLSDGAHRDVAWQWLRHRWSTVYPGWRIVEAPCPPGPWSKGAAIRDVLHLVPDGVVVLADADCWTDGIPTAVKAGQPWAVPHRLVRRLTPTATRRLIAGAEPSGPLAEPAYLGHPGGGITVLSRTLLADVPVDPRFQGWGHEDDAWAIALTTLAGRPWRGVEPLLHLWHPPQPRTSRLRGSGDSWALYLRYCKARGKPHQMRHLLAEIPEIACRSSPASSAAS